MASARTITPGRVQTTAWAPDPVPGRLAPWHDLHAALKWSDSISAVGRCGSWQVVHVIGRDVLLEATKHALRISRSPWDDMPNRSGSSICSARTKTRLLVVRLSPG